MGEAKKMHQNQEEIQIYGCIFMSVQEVQA